MKLTYKKTQLNRHIACEDMNMGKNYLQPAGLSLHVYVKYMVLFFPYRRRINACEYLFLMQLTLTN